ncbi:DUF4352 domain-containing protein [Staphylococcus simulans]|uniref:DUF4352 domain-containing protein n=1 Tax=Staphylococcus simulans TaxID=1286 RepID=UPI00399C055B
MHKLWFIVISALFLLAGCFGLKSQDQTEETIKKDKATDQMQTFKIGQIVDADGVDVQVIKAEYINNYSAIDAPKNGKALQVTLKFKNNNKDKVTVDSTAFTMNIRGETYPDWIGSNHSEGAFTHQLSHGKTAIETVTFDVPEAKVYTLEMDAQFKKKIVKGKWNIHQAMIKKGAHQNDTNQATTSDTKEKHTKKASKEKDYPYSADEYNGLVDLYNTFTKGERMNHVTRGVTNKEYNDLADRVDKLLADYGEDLEAAYQKAVKEEEAEWQKNQDRINKEFEAEMKRQDEVNAREEAQRQKQEEAAQRAYDAEVKRQNEQAAREAAMQKQQNTNPPSQEDSQ